MAIVEVVFTQFEGPSRYGDYSWMVEQREYKKVAMFIYCENTKRQGPPKGKTERGSAVIRDHPQATGVPTTFIKENGKPVPFTTVKGVEKFLQRTIAHIRKVLIRYGRIATVFIPEGEEPGVLGAGQIGCPYEVRKYITDEILRVVSEVNMPREYPSEEDNDPYKWDVARDDHLSYLRRGKDADDQWPIEKFPDLHISEDSSNEETSTVEKSAGTQCPPNEILELTNPLPGDCFNMEIATTKSWSDDGAFPL